MSWSKNTPRTGNVIRSRCPLCRDWATEGESHACTITGTPVVHTNPAAPKPEGDKP